MEFKPIHQVSIQCDPQSHRAAVLWESLGSLFFVLLFPPEDAKKRDGGHCKGTWFL